MLVKRLKAKKSAPAAHSAAKPARKAKVLKPEFSPEEVESFDRQVALHQQAEKAWQRLTSPPEGEDRWGAVEDNLLARSEGTEKRWKYFSK
jgi:hypothetical protein